MDCWLCDYKNETSRSVAKPTWRKFFEALELVDLSTLARHIEKYLKKAPESEIEEPEDKEGIQCYSHVFALVINNYRNYLSHTNIDYYDTYILDIVYEWCM